MSTVIKPVMIMMVVTLWSIFASAQDASPIPYLQNKGKAVQLVVDDKPFLMIAGELHNSSSSTTSYMQPIWEKLVAGNLNTVLAAVGWQQIEPQEGVFDFTLVDSLLKEAGKNRLKLVLLWFGTWKNGESSYIPDWLKKDTKRFFTCSHPAFCTARILKPSLLFVMLPARLIRKLFEH